MNHGFQGIRVCLVVHDVMDNLSDCVIVVTEGVIQLSTQFRILLFFKNLLVTEVLGLCGAPVAFLFQNVADHHPSKPQEKENRHQNKGKVF